MLIHHFIIDDEIRMLDTAEKVIEFSELLLEGCNKERRYDIFIIRRSQKYI